jgi:polar amino acid transport system substrate-binding protein
MTSLTLISSTRLSGLRSPAFKSCKRSKNSFAAILIALTGAFALQPQAMASCGPYSVAYYEYGSFYFKTDQGVYNGIDKVLIEALAQRSGCTLNATLDSRARTWSRLEAGTLAMTVSAIDTPERQKFAEFLPYFKSRNYVLLKNELAKEVPTLAAFDANPKLRLAVVKAFKHGPAVDAWVDHLRALGRVDEYADAEVVARVFARNRADAFLAEVGVWGPLLTRNELENAVKPLDWFPNDSFVAGMALSRQLVSAPDALRLRTAIKAMQKDGSLEKIYLRFMEPEAAKAALP